MRVDMAIESLTNPQLVTLAVVTLGGDVNSIDREDIALKVNLLAPGRFSWRKYPENIDLEAVCVALRDAKKPKNGGLLVGNNNIGWMLSPLGIKWIKSININTIIDSHSIKQRKDSIIANQELELLRLKTTNAFKLFIDNNIDVITLQDFYQFSRVNEYFQTNTKKRRFAIMDNIVLGDEILTNLWNILKSKFSEEFI